MSRRTAFVALTALMLAARVAPAQETSQAGPSFLIVRYASRSSLGMYSGYRAGPALFFVGLLHNPRTEYQEATAGIAHPFGVAGKGSVIVGTAGAYTNTGWYAQLYVVPDLTFGRLNVSFTAEAVQPLSASGTHGVFVSPGNALYDLGGGFSAGLGYYDDIEYRSEPYHGLGPALRRAVPHGSLTFEWIADMTGTSDEFRMTVRSSF